MNSVPEIPRSPAAATGSGVAIGTLGGLIGLGGAEFRLPLLIGVFRFRALEAIILNKAMSLAVVATALPFRTHVVPWSGLADQWGAIINLLAGTLIGAWFGAGWALKAHDGALHRIIAVLLVGIALVLLLGHGGASTESRLVTGGLGVLLAVLAGLAIGAIASLMGVAGGELLIPTLVLLFGLDIKTAGSVSLVVSLPTMLVGFARYSQDGSFKVLRTHGRFVLLMVMGSILGTWIGGQLLGVVPHAILLPLLAAVLILSAVKVWWQG